MACSRYTWNTLPICLAVAGALLQVGGIDSLIASEPANHCPAPRKLTCEFLRRPDRTPIYDPAPEFGWQCGSGEDAFLQTAYRIEVRKADDEQDASVLWDTGRVASRQSIDVEYDGQLLQPATSYEWRVKVWNAAGQPSDWSAPQRFTMARFLNVATTSRHQLLEIPQAAESLQSLPDGTTFADFGKAAFGYLRLRLEPCDSPRSLTVRFGEKLSNGRIDKKPGGSIRYYSVDADVPSGASEIVVRPPRDRRNTTGDAVRLPASTGVLAPFRYVEIVGADLQLRTDDMTRIAVQYPFDENASSFTCSDETLNQIWDLCKYSIAATTFCGIYVDGDRERIPYEADAYINQLAHYGVDQEYALARYSHEYLLRRPTWPTEWKQHSVLMAWADYQYTGNLESLARNYEVLCRDKILIDAELPNGLVDTSTGEYRDIVDWPEEERDGHEMLPVNTVVNAFHYATLDKMALIAEALGRDSDARMFRRKADRLHKVFNDSLWDDATGAYVDGLGSEHSSIHSNLFPLAFGLVPTERVEAVLEFVKSRDMACSVYAAQFLLEGLYRHDADDYALGLLTSRSKRSWYNMLRSGSTITLEAWDIAYKPNLDWNHAWGAAPANLIPMYLVGVRPLEPGFAKVLVQPRPADLTQFAAQVPSIRGPIDVSYERSGNEIQMAISIPGNATATVAVPLAATDRIESVTVDGVDTPIVLRGRHAWIDNVSAGPHAVVATLAPVITQAVSGTPAG